MIVQQEEHVVEQDPEDWRLNELLSSRYGLVVEIARRYAPNADLVPDIAQEAFLEFLHGCQRKKWDLDHDVTPLLWQITKNVALRQWRERQRRTRPVLRKLNDYLCLLRDQASSGEEAPTHGNDSRFETIRFMKECIAKLPEKSKKLIELYYFLDTPSSEIAEMYAVGVRTLQQSIRRIREKLRLCIISRQREDDDF